MSFKNVRQWVDSLRAQMTKEEVRKWGDIDARGWSTDDTANASPKSGYS